MFLNGKRELLAWPNSQGKSASTTGFGRPRRTAGAVFRPGSGSWSPSSSSLYWRGGLPAHPTQQGYQLPGRAPKRRQPRHLSSQHGSNKAQAIPEPVCRSTRSGLNTQKPQNRLEENAMADQTLVALYDDAASARQVLDELRAAGLPHDRFWISGNATGTADLGASRLTDFVRDFGMPESRVRSLTRLGVPEDDAHLYAEGVRRGGTLLIGEVTDADAERALAIIERSSPVDLAERGEHYRTAGWSRYDAEADYTVEQAAEERSRYGTGLQNAVAEFRQANQAPPVDRRETASGEEERIPVVEEQLDIQKRAVERGGVRVRTYVRETPVEEQVTLREEHVHVERRPVDRAVDALPSDAFQDRTIEVRE